jgi:hypothetical protein
MLTHVAVLALLDAGYPKRGLRSAIASAVKLPAHTVLYFTNIHRLLM